MKKLFLILFAMLPVMAVAQDDKVWDNPEVMPQFPYVTFIDVDRVTGEKTVYRRNGDEGCKLFLKKNLRYPEEAERNGVEGRVIVSFFVEEDGSISGAKVMRSVSPLLDEEALRLVNSMPVWEPGSLNGKPTRNRYSLPVKFSLDEARSEENKVYDVVSQMPEFPEMEFSEWNTEAQSSRVYKLSGQQALLKWLSRNIQYPNAGMEAGVQGRVVVSFIVEPDGTTSDAKIVRSLEPSFDKEALRVVGLMNQWIPGRHNGKIVRTRYSLPITFSLR